MNAERRGVWTVVVLEVAAVAALVTWSWFGYELSLLQLVAIIVCGRARRAVERARPEHGTGGGILAEERRRPQRPSEAPVPIRRSAPRSPLTLPVAQRQRQTPRAADESPGRGGGWRDGIA